MRIPLSVGLLAAAALGSPPAPADDVSVRMSLSDTSTAGPLARLTVRNRGTNPQAGVTVRVFAENEGGLELWSGTVDLAPRGTARLAERVYLDADTTVLVATAVLAAAVDADPTDNAARAPLGRGGRTGRAVVGRLIHLSRCASCHGAEAEGAAAPALVGASQAEILAEAAAGGDHDFPWLSRRDAAALARHFADPAGTVLPPPLPPAPPGGWPTYSGAVKPLLDDRCIRCHGPGRVSAGVRLDTLSGAAKNARGSLAAVKSGRMPQGGKRFDPTETGLLRDWIDGGRRP